ncbi:MAG: DNA-directed RNA polymerase subunit D [archaeon]
MKILQKSKEKMIIEDEMDESLANAIRRSALEIPILAVNEVEIYKNDSALYDEIIAHRLGLIPLVTDKTFTEQDKCTCKGKGCAKCSVQLKISTKGKISVFSGDLKGKAKVVYDKMPIVILAEGQELELVATATLGKGINHTKYSPGLIYYRNLAEIEINKDCDACKKCIEVCPYSLIKVDKKAVIDNKELWKCDLCEACVETCKNHGKNAIKVKPGKDIIFFVESWGQLEAKEVFTKAIDSLKDNLKVFKK